MNPNTPIKISPTGEHLPADAAEFAAVLFPATGLMFAVGALPKAMSHAGAVKAAAELTHAGHSDWRLPTVQELVSIVDYSRKQPACDLALFPDAKCDWYWTSDMSAWSPDCAWVVHFGGGGVGSLRRDGYAFVRAVRRVSPAGQ